MSDARDRWVTLLVPGLAGPAAGDDAGAERWWSGFSAPVLGRLLARATSVPGLCPGSGLVGMVFGCFGVESDGPDWPVAAVTARLDGGGDDRSWWMRADPVHLRVDRGALILADPAHLTISAAEAAALSEAINGELAEPALLPLDSARWYVRLDEAPDLVTQPPAEVSGGAIGERLPRGADAGKWRAWINDVQMLLHASPVNREREGRGQVAINSVWPWGGGRCPQVPSARWASAAGENPLVAALASLAGVPVGAGATAEWLVDGAPPGDHLRVLDMAYVPARTGDFEAWRDLVGMLEEEWLGPLLDALAVGGIDGLRLSTGRGTDFSVRRGEWRRRWWRRTRSPALRLWAGR